MSRQAEVQRKTAETQIKLALVIGGTGAWRGGTGIGFLDHMLELFARHGQFDLSVEATGDRAVDDHHTTEDVGICLGQALNQALGDRAGIRRYGDIALPMDEALAQVAVDLGGRPCLVYEVKFPAEKIGDFDTALVEEFLGALVAHGKMNLHVSVRRGHNAHHIAEAIFKAVARALDQATQIDPRVKGVPSTKGML